MFGFDKIIENKIQEAIQNGDFDNLPGKGKPLGIDDLSNVPDHFRMAYKILKNAGVLPEEMQIKKEIAIIEELIASANLPPDEIENEKTKLAAKILKYKILMEKKK